MHFANIQTFLTVVFWHVYIATHPAITRSFYTAKYAVLCTPFSWHGPRVYTVQGKLRAWASTPIYPPWPYTERRFILIHRWRGLGRGVDVNAAALRFRGGAGETAAISTWAVLTGNRVKSTSCWLCERRWCSRIKRRRWKMVRSTRKTQRNCLTRL